MILVGINDFVLVFNLVYLFKYDFIYGFYGGIVVVKEEGIVIDD